MRIWLFVLLGFISQAAFGQIAIDKPWTRATPPGAKVAGGYLVIHNQGGMPDRLVGASSPAAAKVELHVHSMEGGVMKMREVPAYEVPAKGSFELKPGGSHLMFMDVKRPFKEGEQIPVKLRFEKAGEVSAEFQVGSLGQSAPPAGHKH